MNKREVVEAWLNKMCLEIEMCVSASDPYPCEDEDDMLAEAEGLISYVKYDPGTDEWENFAPEGYLFDIPSNEQIERLYPKAKADFDEMEQSSSK